MQARGQIEGAYYGPEALKAMGQAFDEAWLQICDNFGDDSSGIERARLRLARALLSIANEDCRDVAFLKQAALEQMAFDHWTSGSG